MDCETLTREQRSACARLLGSIKGRLYRINDEERDLPPASRIALSYAISRIDDELEGLLEAVIADPRRVEN